MVILDVRDEPGTLTHNIEVIDGEKAAEVADSVTATVEQSRPEEERTAHWYYSVPFPGVRYYGFDQRPLVSKRFNPDKAVRRVGG